MKSSSVKVFSSLSILFMSFSAIAGGKVVLSDDNVYLYGLTSTKWKTTTIPVCWENPHPNNFQGRNWTRIAVKQTWERHSTLRFTGWDRC